MARFRLFLFLAFFLPLRLSAVTGSMEYQIEITGVEECEAAILRESSQIVILKERPPTTLATLQMRIDDDVPNMLKALQSRAYYDARIDVAIDKTQTPLLVTIAVDTGPIYPFASFEMRPEEGCCEISPCDSLSTESLGIVLGEPAYPETILDAEDTLIDWLEQQGYPLAKVARKEIIADQSTQTISVVFYLDRGPLATFGETTVTGSKTLCQAFFRPKIAWSYGSVYDPCLVQRTVGALELSGLFSTIDITHGECVDENGTLPMNIVVREAKKRTIAFGVGVATDLGAGVSAEWEHRNLTGRGDKLSFNSTAWWIKQNATLRYVKPDFRCPRQDFILTLEGLHEDIKAYRERSLSASMILERQYCDTLRFSYGVMATYLNNSGTDDNGDFGLLKTPLQLFWNGADSLLDPTRGATLHLKTVPTAQLISPQFGYAINLGTLTAYRSFDSCGRFVFAFKGTWGGIWGASRRTIPPSERFYAGSDLLLRGYHYMTVSPLNEHNKPIGGRSVMVYSFEMRMRLLDPFGLVGFYDIGNVYEQSVPQFKHKQLQSAGFGIRYHTPVGPLRLDVAFPFTPRRHLDRGFQIYFSIGQTF